MKKLISASKRKWVLGGVLGFAAIALTTTGFATCIVGVQKTQQDGNVQVDVDTANQNGVNLTLTLVKDQNFLEVKEKSTNGEGVVQVEHEKEPENPMTVKVEAFKLQVGKAFLDKNDVTGVSFELKYKTDTFTTDILNNTDNLVKTSTIATEKRTQEKTAGTGDVKDSWEYVAAPKKVEFANTDIAKTGALANGLYTFDIINTKLTTSLLPFQWGSYFNGVTPSTYYNGLFDVNTVTTDEVGQIYSELEAMNTALTGKTFQLSAKLEYTAKQAA